MLIKDIALSIDKLGLEVKIVSAKNHRLEGLVGTLTYPFGEHLLGEVGIFLPEPLDDCDTYNLDLYDIVEFIK